MGPIEAAFPSEAWFAELVARATADGDAMARLGIADLRFAAEIVDGDGRTDLFGILLDGYDIESLGRVDEARFDPEVVLTGPVEAWREMVASIESRGGADDFHTLNSLSIAGFPFTVRSPDPMGNDKFYRFMGTLQAIFDSAGQVPARAPVPVPAGHPPGGGTGG